MEQLKHMKEMLMTCVQGEMANLSEVNTKELGEAIDMIKDLAEATYYCTLTKAMEDCEKEKEDFERYSVIPKKFHQYEPEEARYYTPGSTMYRDNSNGNGNRMYYDGGSMRSEYPLEIRDYREGRSPITRRSYMESKEMHQDKNKQLKELEQYMNELSQDIYEMIEDAEPEQKAILSQKLNNLASKVK